MKKTNTKPQEPIAEIVPKKSLKLSDYAALLYIIALLAIDFLPSFRSIDILGFQFFYFSLVNLVFGVYIYLNRDLFNQNLFSKIKQSLLIKICILILAFCGISVINANNFSLWLVSFNFLTITAVSMIFLIILLNNRLKIFYQICFILGISLFAQCYSELHHLFQSTKISGFSVAVGEIKGNTGNVNIFSSSMNVKIPFIIFGILKFTDWKKWFMMITLFLSSNIVFLLGSRASLLGLIFISITTIFFIFYKSQNLKLGLPQFFKFITPIIFSFIFSTLVFQVNKGTGRSSSVANNLSRVIDTKDTSTSSRLQYWENAGTLIANNPFLGVGIGNWRIESLPLEQTQFNNLLVSEHAHNDFLEIAAESGVLNGILYFAIFVIIFFINAKKVLKSNNKEIDIIALTVILILIGYFVDCFFNFPMYRPTMQIGFIFMLALTILNTDQTVIENLNLDNKKLMIPLYVIMLTTTYFSYLSFQTYRLENDITADIRLPKPVMTAQYILDNLPQYPNVFFNSEPFAEQLGIKFVQEKNYEKAHKYLNMAQKINPHNGRVEWYKFRINKEEMDKDSAFYFAKKAFEVRPRNYDYFISMLYMSNEFKDTVTMLKAFETYNKYCKTPKNYIDASNALHQSNYNKKNILDFVNKGLKEYPKDSLLLDRQRVFEYEYVAFNPNAKLAYPTRKPVTSTEIYIDLLQQAATFGLQGKFDKSLVAYQKVAKIDPKNATITQNIGICYFKLNQFKTAIPYLEKVLNNPTLADGKTEYVLGVCNLNIQNKDKGCQFLTASKAKGFADASQLIAKYCK